MSALTTHVLDTSLGRPASGVKIKLYKLDGSKWTLINKTNTNQDGRTDAPLLNETQMAVGKYQLVFEMEAYFLKTQTGLSTPLFLHEIPIQFGLSDPTSHYHVPLLVSPFGFSTYRGS